MSNTDEAAQLFSAVWDGRADDVIQILKTQPELARIRDSVGDTVFHVAARAGHPQTLIFLTESVPDQDKFVERIKWLIWSLKWLKTMLIKGNVDGDTPLHVAVKSGQLQAADYLYKACEIAKLVRNKDQLYPDDFAIKAGFNQLWVIRSENWALNRQERTKYNRMLIYDHKSMQLAEPCGLLSDIDMKIAQMKLIDEFGVKWSKLYEAAVLGDNITVLNLLSTDRDLIQHHDRNKGTVFHAAASAGQMDTLKLLVQYCNEDITGLLLETLDKDRNTPLHLAIQNGHEMAGIYLHQLSTEAAYQMNYKGVSAISMAVKKKHQNLVKCMLQSNTTVSQQEKLLQFAHKEHLAHSAVKTNNRGMLETILGELPSLKDSYNEKGWKPLSYAVYKGYLDQVHYLLTNFPDLATQCDKDGSFPIHKAAGAGNVSILKHFLEICPSTMHHVDNRGRTILHIAVRYARVDVFSYLIKEKKGIQNIFHVKDNEGKTFKDLAKEFHHQD